MLFFSEAFIITEGGKPSVNRKEINLINAGNGKQFTDEMLSHSRREKGVL